MRTTLLSSLVSLAAVVACQDSSLTSSISSIAPSSSIEVSSSSSASASSSSIVSSSSAVSSTTTSSSSSVVTSSPSTTSTVSSSSSVKASAVTVATDGSAQFSVINAAVAYAQNSGYPSVVVKAGTYSEAIVVTGTQTVTIVGPTASTYAQNQVVVSASTSAGVVSINTSNSKGVTIKNLNLTNTATTGTAPAVYVRGSQHGFYGCALISSSTGVYFSSYGTAIIDSSYIEGSDKLFTNYPTVYVMRSTIVPTVSSNGLIVYGKGATINGVNYNATVVFDSSTVTQKPGLSNTAVYLAAPNGNFTQVVYRNTSLLGGGFIATSGFHSLTCSYQGYSGEFANTGTGAWSTSNSASRTAVCDHQIPASLISSFSIDQVFGNAFSGYGSFDTTWIDSGVLSAIQSFDSAQVASVSTSASSSTVSSTASSVSSGSSSASLVSSVSGSSSTVASSATCATPTPSATLIVSQNATGCQYSNVSAAIAALPNDSKPYTIYIEAGVYQEQLSITRNGKVTLIGETTYVNDYSQNQVQIEFSNGQLTSAGKDESTPILYAKKANDNSGLAAYNIDFINTYPKTTNTAALAADFYGNNIAAYGCSFVGFQDTLLANKGIQLFSNCYISGDIDFIWGFSIAYFHQCYIASRRTGGSVTAQSRTAGTTSGYVIDSSYITYTSEYGSTFQASYLGRPYSNFSTVVYKNSYIDKHIAAAGWNVWSTSSPQTSNVTYGEYNNSGPSAWNSGRASFATLLSESQADAYSLANWIGDTSFIDMTAYNYVPSWTFPASSTTAVTSSTTGSVSTATASINAHPDSGSVPPQYAVIVSADGNNNASYTNVTAAIASLPSDSTNQTIFVYPGSYIEQIPSINRPGAVRIIGYVSGNPGQAYSDNQVTISYARGLSVSPLPTGHSDAETATLATASNKISFYNINFINTDNLDGTESSYVTLAASIYGNDIGFYGCQFNGWQDTLLTGATAGYQYYESCYIGGAIDFIWGYSKAYFKGCTIGAKKAKSAVTAQSRASAAAIGGYIFDQCLFTTAPDATVDLTNTVFLGRPYSQYALVVVKNSYIDDVISPTGWKVWSTTDPRTDYITFAEFNNTGPSNWENNVAARQAFGNATLLTADTYSLASVMDSTSWIDATYWNSIVTPEPAVVNTTSSANVTVSGSSVYNGTVPPTGALIVSQTPIEGVTTYDTIEAAVAAAPTSSKQNATIFIYPGVYTLQEQLVVNKSGYTIFQGYSEATDDYTQNQVTIQQSFGVDTQGDGSDVDAATIYATGNYFYAYNLNMRNNNGTQQNIASLGFAVKSSKYAFLHGCQVYGNQDTLYISGYFFAHKSYIEGNVDFIFGAGSGYFLNSTISPNEDGDSITAAKRATNTTAAGFVFDQCSIVPAAGYTGFKNVSLGRPWNNFARVLYTNSYLDSMIGSAGWVQWSKSSPQTDGVSFYEYHNAGPGSNICNRASFSSQLSDTDVVQFQLANFFTSTSWIDFSVIDVQPFTAGLGSDPAGCATTTSSVVSSTIVSSSTVSTSSSSISLPTVYVTSTVIDKETAYTTLQKADATSTAVAYVTENDGLTVTPSPVIKTSTVKASTVVVSTTTSSGKATTIKSTQLVLATSTVTAKATTSKITSTVLATTTVSGQDTTIKSTETDFTTSTVAGQTSVVKATTTSVFTTTTTPAGVTVTENQGSTVTAYQTSTPKAVTVSSTTTIQAADITKSTSVKAITSTVLVTSVKTTTKGTTITATCTPAAAVRLFRRGLQARAASAVTVTSLTTLTSYVKTSTATLAGSTYFTSVTSTSTINPTTTLKAATSTVVITSFATSTSLVTETVAASTFTSTIVSTSVSTETASANVVTSIAYVTDIDTISVAGNTFTSLATVNSVIKATGAGITSTSLKVVSTTATVTANKPTVTLTKSADSTTTIVTTLPASTSTVLKTVTAKGTTVVITTTPAPVVTTSTVKSTSTVFTTVTKTSKGAAACTA